VKNTNITKSDSLPNKVEINFHVFSALMLDRVLGHVDGADIVAIAESCFAQGSVELSQQLS